MLTPKQRKHLKALAHRLNPVVRVGQHGLASGLIAETGRALVAHELIKVHLDSEGAERRTLAESLAEAAEAELVGVIGKIAMIYKRRDEDPEIKLPE